MPEFTEVRGVTLKLLIARQHMDLERADDAHRVLATFKVERIRDGAPRVFNSGKRVDLGVTTTVVVRISSRPAHNGNMRRDMIDGPVEI